MGVIPKIDSRRLLTPAVHIIFIGIIFVVPEVLMRMAYPSRGPAIPWVVYAKSGIMLAVFYLNFFFLIPQCLIRRHKWWQFIAWNVLLIAGASLLTHWLSVISWAARPRRHEPDQWQSMMATASFLLRDGGMMLLTVSLAVVLRLSGRWVELERRQQKLLASQRESELENLRAQLNPHFLFNTLNSIYALIAVSPDEAQKAVHELSGLLRYVVYENPERVPLEREIGFVENYVELMRLRMGSRPVTLDVSSQGNPEIAPLLFVTLVENAFKHGNTSDQTRPINITINASDSAIRCTTENWFDASARTDRGAGGGGIANLRRRLELIYGGAASLTMKKSSGGTCRVELKIRLQ